MRSRIDDARVRKAVFETGYIQEVLSLAITANFTIPDDAPPAVNLDATSTNRNVVLPTAPGGSKSLSIQVRNGSSSTAVLTVQDPTGPTTVLALAQNEIGEFFTIGTSWYGTAVPSGTDFFSGVTAGTVTSGRGVVVSDVSKNIGTFGTVTMTSLATGTGSFTAGVAASTAVVSNITVSSVATIASVAAATATISTAVLGGGAVTGTLAFYNAALTSQPAAASQAAVTFVSSISITACGSTIFGFSTSDQGNNCTILVNRLRADLVTLGLIKGAA